MLVDFFVSQMFFDCSADVIFSLQNTNPQILVGFNDDVAVAVYVPAQERVLPGSKVGVVPRPPAPLCFAKAGGKVLKNPFKFWTVRLEDCLRFEVEFWIVGALRIFRLWILKPKVGAPHIIVESISGVGEFVGGSSGS